MIETILLSIRPLKRFPRLTGAVLFLSLASAAVEAGVLSLLLPLLDASRSQLRPGILWLAGALVLRSACGFVSELAASRLRLATLTDLRLRLLAAFHSIPFGEARRADSTALPNLFLTQTQGCLSAMNSVLGLFNGTVVLLIYAVALLKWRHSSGWILALGIPLAALSAWISSRINRQVREHAGRVTASEEELGRLLLDDLEGKAVVQSFGVTEARLQLHAHAEARFGRNSEKLQRWLAAGKPAMDGLAAITVAGMLLAGPWSRDLPLMMGMFLVLYRLQGWAGLIHHSLSELSEHAQEVRNIIEFLDRPEIRKSRAKSGTESGVPSPRTGRSLVARDAGFSFGAQRPALLRASLRLERGQWVAIVGRTGSGKTTLSQLLSGLLEPQHGEVLLDGLPLKASDCTRLLGVAFERPFLFNETIGWNIHCGRALPYPELVEAVRASGILDFILSLPEQFETRVGFRGVELSNGQRQRIALARALAARPPILILDEATSAVDPATERRIHAYLRARGAETAVLLITHRLQAARDADRIVVLEQGVVVGEGPHDALLRECATYRELCREPLTGSPSAFQLLESET